jgi:hypothetical protein
MSIVVFDPDKVDGVDFQDRMRHPMAEDPSNGMWLSDTEPAAVDALKLRQERLAKLRKWLKASGYGGVVLFDPYNQRYATGTRNMFGYFLRNSTRYIFIPAEGPITLFDYPQSYHVSTALETIDEARPSKLVWSSVSGKDEATAVPFAAEIADLMRRHAPGVKKIGLDRSPHLQALALEANGLEVKDCQGEILSVRAVKTPEEIMCLQISMAGAEAAVAAVREAIRPGISENELFAIMYGEVDPPGRRVHRNAALDYRPAHQSLVQRGEWSPRTSRRTGGARYRYDWLLWLLFRFLAYIPLRTGQADRLPENAIPNVL